MDRRGCPGSKDHMFLQLTTGSCMSPLHGEVVRGDGDNMQEAGHGGAKRRVRWHECKAQAAQGAARFSGRWAFMLISTTF